MASFNNTLSTIVFRSDMTAEFVAIAASVHAPGYSSIDVDYTDVSREAIDLKAFRAGISKCLFMRSDINTQNNITDQSARKTEYMILDYLLDNQLVEAKKNPMDQYPLMRCDVPDNRGNARFNHANLNNLRTNFVGGGWANSNYPRIPVDPMQNVYPNCAGRVRFGNSFDNFRAYKDDASILFNGWAIASAVNAMFASAKTGQKGIATIFREYERNIFDFFTRMNEYLSENWYSGLGLPINLQGNLIPPGQEERVPIIKVRSRTVIAFAANIKTSEKYLRRVPCLSIYDPAKETVIFTDASLEGLGAVLKQRQEDGSFKPVAYFSKKLNDAKEKKSSIFRMFSN